MSDSKTEVPALTFTPDQLTKLINDAVTAGVKKALEESKPVPAIVAPPKVPIPTQIIIGDLKAPTKEQELEFHKKSYLKWAEEAKKATPPANIQKILDATGHTEAGKKESEDDVNNFISKTLIPLTKEQLAEQLKLADAKYNGASQPTLIVQPERAPEVSDIANNGMDVLGMKK